MISRRILNIMHWVGISLISFALLGLFFLLIYSTIEWEKAEEKKVTHEYPIPFHLEDYGYKRIGNSNLVHHDGDTFLIVKYVRVDYNLQILTKKELRLKLDSLNNLGYLDKR